MRLTHKLSLFMLSLVVAGGAAAHDSSHKQHDYQANIAARLQLDANQIDKLEKIMAKHREATDKIREAHEKHHEQEQAELKTLRDNQRKDLAALLTPAQLAEFDKMQKKRHLRHHHRHHSAMDK